MPETVMVSARGEAYDDGFKTAADILFKQVFKRANLPRLLAFAAMAGYREEVLEALIAWGTGKRTIDDVWEEVSPMAQKNCVAEGVEPSNEEELVKR